MLPAIATLAQAARAPGRTAFLPSDRWAELSLAGGAGAEKFHARHSNVTTSHCQEGFPLSPVEIVPPLVQKAKIAARAKAKRRRRRRRKTRRRRRRRRRRKT
jgi:hypothetical protein